MAWGAASVVGEGAARNSDFFHSTFSSENQRGEIETQ
jgi:hypothetical protein